MAKYVDAHFHLDLFANANEIALEIEKSEVFTIAVTNTPSVFFFTQNLAKGKKFLRPALGLHPELAVQREHELPQMWDLLSQTKYIGEIGLDYKGLDQVQVRRQQKIFESIIEKCADYGDKILSIHSRRCEGDIIERIGAGYPGKVILHWYSGSLKNLSKAIEYGFFFSINQRMLDSSKGREIIRNIPVNRLLTESDGPFIMIKSQKAVPFALEHTVAVLRHLYNIHDVERMKTLIFQNFKRLLTS